MWGGDSDCSQSPVRARSGPDAAAATAAATHTHPGLQFPSRIRAFRLLSRRPLGLGRGVRGV